MFLYIDDAAIGFQTDKSNVVSIKGSEFLYSSSSSSSSVN